MPLGPSPHDDDEERDQDEEEETQDHDQQDDQPRGRVVGINGSTQNHLIDTGLDLKSELLGDQGLWCSWLFGWSALGGFFKIFDHRFFANYLFGLKDRIENRTADIFGSNETKLYISFNDGALWYNCHTEQADHSVSCCANNIFDTV